MAEPLKNQFGSEIPKKIARMIADVYPEFNTNEFIKDALNGYEELELTPRGRKIAHTLKQYLPDNYPVAIDILIKSIGSKLDVTENMGMAPFLYLPHVIFVAEHGLDHFETSMQAQYELTQRFTAEFSIRAFLERYPDETLARLKTWANDPNVHVRRLVSEGTRPLLPWAPRLHQFQKDPAPVLELLELLKDDPELYVRRSVANNLNDIGKDHPEILVEVAQRWMKDASKERRWLIRHALRSAIKRGDPGALAVLGYGDDMNISVIDSSITPLRLKIGDAVKVYVEIKNEDTITRQVMTDCRVHFVKANGKANPKVFKLKSVSLKSQETVTTEKSISLQDMTTRRYYPGVHKVDILINGAARPLGEFEVESSGKSEG